MKKNFMNALKCLKISERGGRLFIIGVGGSAANASHAVNDFRKNLQYRGLIVHLTMFQN